MTAVEQQLRTDQLPPGETPITTRPQRGLAAVSILAAILLLAAACLKWEQLPVIHRMGDGLLHAPRIAAAQVAFEVGLALLLLSMAWSRAVRWLTAAVFGVFTLVTLYLALTGATSCECFGRLTVNPWVTFALDLATTTALIWAAKHSAAGHHPRTPTWRYAILSLAFVSAAALTLARLPRNEATPVPAEIGLTRASGLIILEPEKWQGVPFPLSRYTRDLSGAPAAQLSTGRWRLVIYDNDCSHCRETIPKLLAGIGPAPKTNYAFIEKPPYASPPLVPRSAPAAHLRLEDTVEWFIQAPVTVELDSGTVTQAAAGPAADTMVTTWLKDPPQ